MLRPVYFIRKAIDAMVRAPFVTLVATGTIFVGAYVTGVFAVCLVGAERALATWGGDVRISVYLSPGTDLEQARAAAADIAPRRAVEALSAQAALGRLKESLGDQASALDGVRDDVLPASVEVHVPGISLAEARDLAARLRQIPGASEVDYGAAWFERLAAFLRRLRIGGLALLIALSLATAVLVGNTLRLAIYARRDEIEIMKLVGATHPFVETPFLIEGLLQGLLGAGLAVLALLATYAAIAPAIQAGLGLPIGMRRGDLISSSLLVALVGGGGGLGLLASFFSVARFLRKSP